MKIAVEASGWSRGRGYGRLTRNVVERLVALHPEHELLLYVADADSETPLPDGVQVRPVALAHVPGSIEVGEGRTAPDIFRLTRAVLRDRPDVLLCPSLWAYLPVPRVPVVVGIHDATLRTSPASAFPTRRNYLAWRIKTAVAVRKAARLFTISNAAGTDVSRAFGISGERLTVVPLAPDPVFGPRSAPEVAAASRAVELGEDEPIVVYAAGFEPHKDVGTLVSAFAALRLPAGRPPRLVIAGRVETPLAEEIRARVRELGLASRVVFPGFVSDDVLAALYTRAHAAVVSSVNEGFGFPAVEAAACGAPTILSDIPAHRETLGDAALFFDPTDADGLQDLLERVLADEALRTRVGAACREASAARSWDDAAHVLERLLRAAGEGT